MSSQPLVRADQVGSLLRPDSVKQAWSAFERGDLDAEARRAVEDDAVRTLVAEQEATGIGMVSDGEFRRDVWWSGFIPFIDGIEIFQASSSPFDKAADTAETASAETADTASTETAAYVPKLLRTVGPLRHPGAAVMGHDHVFLAGLTQRIPKITIPAPSRFHFQYGTSSLDPAIYPDRDEFWADVAAVYQAEIASLEAQGCSFIQLDDPVLSFFCDPTQRDAIAAQGEDPDQLLGQYVSALNAAVSKRRADTSIGLHICRGNAKSVWAVSGGYAAIAAQTFPLLDVDTYYLEFDDDRAGDFQPLEAIPERSSVVLGLVTTKRGDMEASDLLKRRVAEAATVIDADRLALSPQCGFASVLEGNLITEEEQWAKLRLVSETAADLWS